MKNKIKIRFFTILKNGKETPFNVNDYQTVLIFMHTMGIGDAIVCSGFIDILRKHNKKVYIITGKRIFLIQHIYLYRWIL